MIKKILKKNSWNYDSDNLRGCRTHKTSIIKTKFIPKQFVTELKPSYSYTSQWHHYIHVHYTSSKNLEKVKIIEWQGCIFMRRFFFLDQIKQCLSDTHLQASFLMSPNHRSFIPKQGIQVLLHRQNKTFPVPGYFTSLFDVNSFNI